MSGPVDVLTANVEVRLWDSQWVSVVNHADCYRDMDKDEAVATAVRLTERLMADNITAGFPPATYDHAAVAELREAAKGGRDALWLLAAMGNKDAAEKHARLYDALARVGAA